MIRDDGCTQCEKTPCQHGCAQSCEATPPLDRRRFIIDLSRYTLATAAAAAGIGGVTVVRRANAAAAEAPEPIVNSLGMQLVHIPAGSFTMGSEDNDDEKPVHEVTMSKPILLAVCEASNADYRAFVAATGHAEPGVAVESKKKVRPWQGRMFSADRQPVVCVTWDDAVAFCGWLSEKEGVQYRLPTEAEWEHACRAGTRTKFYWGDEPAGREKAYFAEAWPEETKEADDWQETPWGLHTTVAVECEERNPLGLCHMAGNAWEWTADWYGDYSEEAQTDPTGPAEGKQKVTRGGSRFHAPSPELWRVGDRSRVATASVRRPKAPNACCRNCGFRIVREV